MGQLYYAEFENVAITAAQDIFEVLAPADAVIKLHSIYLGQSTDVGDAAEEILRLKIQRGAGVTSGSGGSTVTPAPLENGMAAAGATVEANNTTEISAGTITDLMSLYWNIRVPFEMIFTPETQPVISASDTLVLALMAAPADSITCAGTLVFEEIGG